MGEDEEQEEEALLLKNCNHVIDDNIDRVRA